MLSLLISNFRSMQLLKEWPRHCKCGKSLISAWLSFSSVSHISYYVNFRFNNGLNMLSVLAGFLLPIGRNSYKGFRRNILCYVSERCVKDFNGSKRIKDSFNVFIFCVLKKRCLRTLTINLKFNFYQINFIQWFYENGRSKDKMYAIKTKNFESDIIRIRDFYF